MEKKKRLGGPDTLRGLTLISMMGFHAYWDLVYIFGVGKIEGIEGLLYLWQQSICRTFIFLSGFCWILGRKPVKRGLIVSALGLLIMFVTAVFMYEQRVEFGVLTLLGASMLLLVPLDKIGKKITPSVGIACSFLLFFLFRNVNHGRFGFETLAFGRLPETLYRNRLSAFFGFPPGDFYSTDYFSLFPWFFLFLAGYFSSRILWENSVFRKKMENGLEPFAFLGRHSLFVYMIHQPVIYGLLYLLFGLN